MKPRTTMAKQRILFLIESLIVGGAEKVLTDIVNNLDADRYDITVCSVFKESVYKGYNKYFHSPFKPHIHYRYLINNRITWWYRIFNYLLPRIPASLYRLLVGDKYDKIVAFYEGLPTYWIAKAPLKKGEKIAWLHTSTSLSQKGKDENALKQQEKLYNQYVSIVAVSNGVKDSFVSLFPTQEAKVKVAYNPIDVNAIKDKAVQPLPINIPTNHYPIFVSVGRMTAVKGYDRWLRVIYQLKQKGYQFQVWIIGGGDRNQLEQYVKEKQLTDYVCFYGHQENPYPYMAKADWVICPSLIEGLSTVVLEALALGKAIAVTDCPGMKELLGDSQYGIVMGNDENSLVKGIESILCDSSLQRHFEQQALIRSKTFELTKAISKVEFIFNF